MSARRWWLVLLIMLSAALAGEHLEGWGYAPDDWTASAGAEGAPEIATESAPLAFDREQDTRWTTGRDMQPGDWYAVDLGQTRTIGRIQLDAGTFRRDFPRRVKLEVGEGDDGWRELKGVEVLLGDDGSCRFTFQPLETRRFRIVNGGTATGLWWSIHELYVWAK